MFQEDKENGFEVEVPCDCMTERIVIHKFDDDYDIFYVSFYVDSFYPAQSVRSILWDRIKMAWKALRKGNFIFQEVVLNLKTITELRDGLTKLIEIKESGKDK